MDLDQLTALIDDYMEWESDLSDNIKNNIALTFSLYFAKVNNRQWFQEDLDLSIGWLFEDAQQGLEDLLQEQAVIRSRPLHRKLVQIQGDLAAQKSSMEKAIRVEADRQAKEFEDQYLLGAHRAETILILTLSDKLAAGTDWTWEARIGHIVYLLEHFHIRSSGAYVNAEAAVKMTIFRKENKPLKAMLKEEREKYRAKLKEKREKGTTKLDSTLEEDPAREPGDKPG
jgi:hypothetical protein